MMRRLAPLVLLPVIFFCLMLSAPAMSSTQAITQDFTSVKSPLDLLNLYERINTLESTYDPNYIKYYLKLLDYNENIDLPNYLSPSRKPHLEQLVPSKLIKEDLYTLHSSLHDLSYENLGEVILSSFPNPFQGFPIANQFEFLIDSGQFPVQTLKVLMLITYLQETEQALSKEGRNLILDKILYELALTSYIFIEADNFLNQAKLDTWIDAHKYRYSRMQLELAKSYQDTYKLAFEAMPPGLRKQLNRKAILAKFKTRADHIFAALAPGGSASGRTISGWPSYSLLKENYDQIKRERSSFTKSLNECQHQLNR